MSFDGNELDFGRKRGKRDQLKMETVQDAKAGVVLLGVKKIKVVKVKV